MDSTFVLSHIIVYPIKSLAGVSMHKWWIEERGLRYDRRWLIIDDQNKFITQREHPQMALLDVALRDEGILLHHRMRADLGVLRVPYQPQTSETLNVRVWKLIGQASLDDLNTRLENPIEMRRFRPNFVIEGSTPYDEDHWYEFEIGQMKMYGVKPCARCFLTTVNPETGTVDSKEPIRTLSTYRKHNNKIFFGQNILTQQRGMISVGDDVKVISREIRQTGVNS